MVSRWTNYLSLTFFLFSVARLQKILLLVGTLPLMLLYQLSSSYYTIGQKYALVRFFYDKYFLKDVFLQLLPFFLMGVLLQKWKDRILGISPKRSVYLLIISMVIYGFEVFCIFKFHLYQNPWLPSMPFYPVLALMIFALTNPNIFSMDRRHAVYCRKLSAFIYYFQPYPTSLIPFFAIFDNCTSADRFIISLVVMMTIGSIIYLINNKYLNYLFS